MPFARHHQVALESPHIEVKVTRLNNEGHIDIGGDHLETDATAGPFPSQKRCSGKNFKNARMGTGVVITDADPIANAGQVNRRFAGVEGPARELRGDFALRVCDDVLAAVDGSYSGDGLFGVFAGVRGRVAAMTGTRIGKLLLQLGGVHVGNQCSVIRTNKNQQTV